MPKLQLKRSPEEEALRKQRKKEKKKRKYYSSEPSGSTSHKRPRTAEDGEPERRWASSDEDEEYGPQPAPSDGPSHHGGTDRNKFRAEMDDMRFRDDAFADDETQRLDALEARLNEYAHVPGRWRAPSARTHVNAFEDDWLKVDPQGLDDEEYVEWIRMGMYRKTHANEYAEQQRQKAAYAARRAEEKARRAETARLKKAEEEQRKQKKMEQDARQWEDARKAYDTKWQALLSEHGGAGTLKSFGFGDIPWPIFHAHKGNSSKHRTEKISVTLDDLTPSAISAFLLRAEEKRSRKEVLREAMLRFHPDKFEGRFMKLVGKGEEERVSEGIVRVVHVLNRLMED